MGRKISLVTLMDRYNDDAKCRDTLESIRWPAGVACLRCGDMDVARSRAAISIAVVHAATVSA